ncbi:MAG: carbohydrate ABC transporter permease [Chloroflexi bacterium]|nr:carbohydrate ABC transporter permease [Chloroflexota bacterium]
MTGAVATVDRTPSERRLRIARMTSTAIVLVVLLIQTYPIAWIFITSLRTPADFAGSNPFSLPSELTLDNYVRAFQDSDLVRYFLNSFIVAGGSIILLTALSMMAAYAIRILGFRGNQVVLALFLLGIIVPVQVVLIPLFISYSNVGLLDSYQALILPMVGFALPMSVYLFVSFYGFIQGEILEAAVLDGCGPFTAFRRIILPMSTNTIVTVAFVNAVFIWNDFIFANTFIFDQDLKTIPLGLQDFIGAMGATDWTATFAAVSVTLVPLLLVFLVLNRAIIYGLESGATKG